MTSTELSELYRGYIACLNRRNWPGLGRFVHKDVVHNGVQLGLAGYREMLERDVRAIPDLRFDIDILVCAPPRVACRLVFDCTPAGILFDLPVNGRRVSFSENVIYAVVEDRIHEVWSVIDKAAIAAQISDRGSA